MSRISPRSRSIRGSDGSTSRASRKELAIVRHRMAEIAEIAGLDTELVITVGNYDIRLDTFLSQNAAACEGVKGFALRDHIDPCWAMAWQVEINGSGPNGVLVRHRFKSGAGAGRANVLAAGCSVITTRRSRQCSPRSPLSSKPSRPAPSRWSPRSRSPLCPDRADGR